MQHLDVVGDPIHYLLDPAVADMPSCDIFDLFPLRLMLHCGCETCSDVSFKEAGLRCLSAKSRCPSHRAIE